MEDEEIIRDTAGDMLRHYGYDVAFARDGTEANTLSQLPKIPAGTPVLHELILMDRTIPGEHGRQGSYQKNS